MSRVLITGGASGLGAALARAYAEQGADVLVADVATGDAATTSDAPKPPSPSLRNSGGDSEGASPIHGRVGGTGDAGGPVEGAGDAHGRVDSIRLDVRSDDDWAAALAWVEEHWGGLDVLVNNAGVAGGGRVDVATMDEWQWITEINLFGVVRGTRTFAPTLKRQRSGRIVNVASLAGLVHPAGMASYNAVKAGVVAFTETMSHELAAYGVRTHVVCPSYFRTNLVASLQGADTAVGAVLGALVDNAPLGPDEIAAEVLAAVDRGEELILPDPAARQAYELKTTDRAAYDKVMRAQAVKLEEQAGQA